MKSFLRLFGMTAGMFAIAATLAACGGAKADWNTVDSKDSLTSHCLLEADGKTVTCDVSDCDPESTLFARVGEKNIEPLAVCPTADENPSVTFVNTLPGTFDIVCLSGDSDKPVLLAKNFGVATSDVAGGGTTGGSTGHDNSSGDDTILPTGTTGGGTNSGGATAGGTTGGGTSGPIWFKPGLFTPTPTGNPIIGISISDSFTAKARNDIREGMVDLKWSVMVPDDQIAELYLWSVNSFNRQTGDDPACGLVGKRYLLVDPKTGENYNAGSPNANAMADLLEGKICDNQNGDSEDDCQDLDASTYSGYSPCRIDLKQNGTWMTSSSVATIAGPSGDTSYTLVVKTKNGNVKTYVASTSVPTPTVTGVAGQYMYTYQAGAVGEADSLVLHAHYENAMPGVAVTAMPSTCVISAGGTVPNSGKSDFEAKCPIQKDSETYGFTVPGFSTAVSQSASFHLGAAHASLNNDQPLSVDPGQDHHGTTQIFYSVSRDYALQDYYGNVLAQGTLASLYLVGDIHLQVRNEVGLKLFNDAQVQSGANKTGSFQNVAIDHEHFLYQLVVGGLEAGTASFTSVPVGYPYAASLEVSATPTVTAANFSYVSGSCSDGGVGTGWCDETFDYAAQEVVTFTAKNIKSIKTDNCLGIGTVTQMFPLNVDYTTSIDQYTINLSEQKEWSDLPSDSIDFSQSGLCTFTATGYDGTSIVKLVTVHHEFAHGWN